MKLILSIVAIVIAIFYFSGGGGGSAPGGGTTRGDVADRRAATEVARCAAQYRDPAWTVCLEAVSESEGRNPERVAAQVNRQEGRTVFALD